MDNMVVWILVGALALGAFLFIGSSRLQPGAPPETTDKSGLDESDTPLPGYGTSGEATKIDLSGLNSLSYRVDGTFEGEPATYWFRGKNFDTSREVGRMDVFRSDGSIIYILIVNRRLNTAWIKEPGSSTWDTVTGSEFSMWWNMWGNRFHNFLAPYQTPPANWEDIENETYTMKGESGSARVYNIKVNEQISDDVFKR